MVTKNGLIPLQGPWESWFQTNAVNNMLEMYWIKGDLNDEGGKLVMNGLQQNQNI